MQSFTTLSTLLEVIKDTLLAQSMRGLDFRLRNLVGNGSIRGGETWTQWPHSHFIKTNTKYLAALGLSWLVAAKIGSTCCLMLSFLFHVIWLIGTPILLKASIELQVMRVLPILLGWEKAQDGALLEQVKNIGLTPLLPLSPLHSAIDGSLPFPDFLPGPVCGIWPTYLDIERVLG